MDDRRRRARLTPLSGELKAMVEWTPSDPTVKEPKRRRRHRRERALPTTRTSVILHGLRRFVLIVGLLGGATALLAGLVVSLGGGSAGSVFPFAFYLAGAALGAMAILGGTSMGGPRVYGLDRPARTQSLGLSVAYGVFGAVLFGIGVALDYLL